MSDYRKGSILIYDFGSQYVQVIARRVRENHVYCAIVPHSTPAQEVKRLEPAGIILSGGPASVYDPNAPAMDAEVFRLGIPVLGICYGLQIGAKLLGAQVKRALTREYGPAVLNIVDAGPLFDGVKTSSTVWMSHGDRVENAAKDFSVLASTDNCEYAAVKHRTCNFYGVQFHPEVTHTEQGRQMLNNFLFKVAGCRPNWRMADYITEKVDEIRARVGDRKVVCGLSGGVDSSVTAVLIHRAVGRQLTCIFVDNGVLRKGEAKNVIQTFRDHMEMELVFVDATERFLGKLQSVTDPEQKRKIIGHEFIAVFREEAKRIKNAHFLAQGTLYPDVIESMSFKGGPSASIKSHHNVGGLPQELGFELLEPLKELFKDEVRELGRALGIPERIVRRQPFPGPGLAVRIIGEVSPERLRILRDADDIVLQEIHAAGFYNTLWQAFAVLLPVSTVGVMGDERTYENVIALRAVTSTDGMTADWARLPHELLARISSRLINEVRGVNRAVYDISSKPPSTIEWE